MNTSLMNTSSALVFARGRARPGTRRQPSIPLDPSLGARPRSRAALLAAHRVIWRAANTTGHFGRCRDLSRRRRGGGQRFRVVHGRGSHLPASARFLDGHDGACARLPLPAAPRRADVRAAAAVAAGREPSHSSVSPRRRDGFRHASAPRRTVATAGRVWLRPVAAHASQRDRQRARRLCHPAGAAQARRLARTPLLAWRGGRARPERASRLTRRSLLPSSPQDKGYGVAAAARIGRTHLPLNQSYPRLVRDAPREIWGDMRRYGGDMETCAARLGLGRYGGYGSLEIETTRATHGW